MGALALSEQSGYRHRDALRILVLDDDSFDRKRLKRWAERGMHGAAFLHEAPDVSTFSTSIAKNEYDLALVDYALADGTGLDAVDLMRACPRNATSYVVMVSGYDDRQLRNACLARGCDAFLSKSELGAQDVANLLSEARARVLEPALPQRTDGQSALAYWRERGALRNKRAASHGAPDNVAVLRKTLAGLEGLKEKTPSTLPVMRTDPKVTATLRHFINDFLACDEFSFEDDTRRSDPNSDRL